MPEYPDITVYVERLRAHVQGQPLNRIRIASPFVLRSVDPPISALEGQPVIGVSKLGKRIVLEFDDELFLVIHLMISGRLRWKDAGKPIPKRVGLAAFDFPNGTVMFTEQSKRKRASIHLVKSKERLRAEHDRGGLDVMTATPEDFRTALIQENRTLKRGLTDPRLFSGIGNAYSDEILHAARLSPFQLTRNLSEEETERLRQTVISTMQSFASAIREEIGDAFPDKVTAYRKDMSVHGRYGEPCPACGSPVQRIVYAQNEANYCATCQTGGKLLADRALSKLLKKDWPKTLEELEERRADLKPPV